MSLCSTPTAPLKEFGIGQRTAATSRNLDLFLTPGRSFGCTTTQTQGERHAAWFHFDCFLACRTNCLISTLASGPKMASFLHVRASHQSLAEKEPPVESSIRRVAGVHTAAEFQPTKAPFTDIYIESCSPHTVNV